MNFTFQFQTKLFRSMKQFYVLASMLFILNSLSAQSSKQVDWTFTSKKVAEKTYEVSISANIKGNWHIYSQDGGEGPVSTTFTFTKNPLVSLEGKTKESGKMKKVHEEAFGSDVRFYEKSVDFVQVVKLKGNVKTNVVGKVEFMVCNDRECLPPAEIEFKVNIGG